MFRDIRAPAWLGLLELAKPHVWRLRDLQSRSSLAYALVFPMIWGMFGVNPIALISNGIGAPSVNFTALICNRVRPAQPQDPIPKSHWTRSYFRMGIVVSPAAVHPTLLFLLEFFPFQDFPEGLPILVEKGAFPDARAMRAIKIFVLPVAVVAFQKLHQLIATGVQEFIFGLSAAVQRLAGLRSVNHAYARGSHIGRP